MELRQLKYFIEVAKREHVTEAAIHMHVAQSAVSRQITNLEEELGVQLFTREGRNVKLTKAGALFMEHAQAALDEIELAKRKVDEFLNPESGQIHLGFPNTLAPKTLTFAIASFKEQHPDIGFHLKQGTHEQLLEKVVSGEIDIALVSPVPKHHPDVTGHIFFSEKILALLPLNHPLAGKPSLRLDELRSEHFVTFSNGFSMRDLFFDACKHIGFKPHISFEGDDADTIKGLVAAGLGITLLPEMSLSDNVPRETKRMNISEPDLSRSVGVIVTKKRELAPSDMMFYRFLISFYDMLNQFGQ
ncbi:LysR family transcriptional regulator [Aureibacillus halotolerans]|uniref:LysR family transcriptional activator of glutamate synthase operon n=1 Tax=Aureibacillus halotolerans TaxID=1508390 RepID=A0A4R6U0D0_9BACI|nr:LysR family transcriptional regulator [Aureibacillus halotolerans]TDQ39758.1 LysR family transcriptional activator of glutamate synthase operon [Aureibacillus halotolerans]